MKSALQVSSLSRKLGRVVIYNTVFIHVQTEGDEIFIFEVLSVKRNKGTLLNFPEIIRRYVLFPFQLTLITPVTEIWYLL